MLVGLVGGTEELQLKDEKQNINQIQSLWWINVLAIFFVKPQKKKKNNIKLFHHWPQAKR